MERGPRHKRLEPTPPQPLRLLVQVCRAPDKLWGKLVLVASRLHNSLQAKLATLLPQRDKRRGPPRT